MTFDSTTKGKVILTMYDHIDNVIDKAPEIPKSGIGRSIATPTNQYTVRDPQDGNELLPDKERNFYHTLTTWCRYVSKQGRPTLQTAITFHYT